VVAIVATALLARFAIGLETPRWLERRFGQPAGANAANGVNSATRPEAAGESA